MKSSVWYLACLLALSACHATASDDDDNPVVAYVNDVPIFKRTVCDELFRSRSENDPNAMPAELPQTGRKVHQDLILQGLIDQSLLLQAAAAQQLSVSQQELTTFFDLSENKWPQTLWNQTLAKADLADDDFRALVQNDLLIRKYMRDFVFARIAITDAQIEAYAAGHPEKMMQPEQIRVYRWVAHNPNDLQTWLSELKKSPNTFQSLAQTHSIGPEAVRGGDLGWIARGMLPQSLEAACDSVGLKKPSPMVEYGDNYHIFWVQERMPQRQATLAQMRTPIENLLRQQQETKAQQDHIATLREASRIRIELEGFSLSK